MGDASDTNRTIFQSSIIQVLAAEPGESASATGKATDVSQVLETFDIEQMDPVFRQKVFKRTLDEIINKFERTKDPQALPIATVKDIKDGLNNTSSGFYTLLEDSRTSPAAIKELNAVFPKLLEAQTNMLEATTLLDEQEDEQKGKRHDYYAALLKCRHEMFAIKRLLKAWRTEKAQSRLAN